MSTERAQLTLESLFSPAEIAKPRKLSGEDLKRSNMESVERHTPDWYRDKFHEAVKTFAKGRLFTVEDVREIAGDPPIEEVSSNCMGPLMVSLARKGLARKTGFHVKARRPQMNATELAQWVRV